MQVRKSPTDFLVLENAKSKTTFTFWLVLRDERREWQFSLLNDDQISKKVRVKHLPLFVAMALTDVRYWCNWCPHCFSVPGLPQYKLHGFGPALEVVIQLRFAKMHGDNEGRRVRFPP